VQGGSTPRKTDGRSHDPTLSGALQANACCALTAARALPAVPRVVRASSGATVPDPLLKKTRLWSPDGPVVSASSWSHLQRSASPEVCPGATVGTTGQGYPRYPAKLLALDPLRQGTGSGAHLYISPQYRLPSSAGSRARHVPVPPFGPAHVGAWVRRCRLAGARTPLAH
jgi:hypothetical protein